MTRRKGLKQYFGDQSMQEMYEDFMRHGMLNNRRPHYRVAIREVIKRFDLYDQGLAS